MDFLLVEYHDWIYFKSLVKPALYLAPSLKNWWSPMYCESTLQNFDGAPATWLHSEPPPLPSAVVIKNSFKSLRKLSCSNIDKWNLLNGQEILILLSIARIGNLKIKK